MSLSKKTKGSPSGSAANRSILLPCGQVPQKWRVPKRQDFGAELRQEIANGCIGDVRIAAPARSRPRLRDLQAAGKAGHGRPRGRAEERRRVLQAAPVPTCDEDVQGWLRRRGRGSFGYGHDGARFRAVRRPRTL